MTLLDYLDGHDAAHRGIGTKATAGYDTAIRSLCRYTKYDVRSEELTKVLINGWLAAISWECVR